MIRRFLPLFLALTLAACAFPVPPTRPVPPSRGLAVDAVLAPFEDAALLPRELAGLPYDEGRAYALLVVLPSPGAVDLSDPARAHRGLGAFLNPLAIMRAGTSIGHAMVGWRCAGGQAGLASKTGDGQGRGYRMLRQGWGLGAFLATYDDGHLLTLADMPARHRRAMRNGRARIVALEISETGCQRMRQALAGYLAEPEFVRGEYTLLPTAARPHGDACGGFALWLAGEGGAMGALPEHLMRRVALRDSFVGRGRGPGEGLVPLPTSATEPISLARLIAGDWTGGAVVGDIRLLDMELFQLALERGLARADLAPATRVPLDDPTNQTARQAADHWLARWPVAIPARIGRAEAVLLQRP